MNKDYAVLRVKSIIASFVGIDVEDVEEEMTLSEFHMRDDDIFFLMERIEEEFDGDLTSGEFTLLSTVEEIIRAVL